MQHKTSQSGRSMVEMLGVIAIIGLITVAGITSMGYVDSYFRSTATVIEIDNLARDVLDTYSWSRNFDRLSMATICDEEILRCTGAQGINRWGGNITVEAIATGENANDMDSFKIIYTNVPKIPCEQLKSSAQNNEFNYVTTIQNLECLDAGTNIEFFLK